MSVKSIMVSKSDYITVFDVSLKAKNVHLKKDDLIKSFDVFMVYTFKEEYNLKGLNISHQNPEFNEWLKYINDYTEMDIGELQDIISDAINLSCRMLYSLVTVYLPAINEYTLIDIEVFDDRMVVYNHGDYRIAYYHQIVKDDVNTEVIKSMLLDTHTDE